MGGKKGGDKGVDGYFYYIGEGGATETGVISVKAGGNVNPNMVRDIGRFPALQTYTLAELFGDIKPKLPPLVSVRAGCGKCESSLRGAERRGNPDCLRVGWIASLCSQRRMMHI
jgi:hypothetical protein